RILLSLVDLLLRLQRDSEGAGGWNSTNCDLPIPSTGRSRLPALDQWRRSSRAQRECDRLSPCRTRATRLHSAIGTALSRATRSMLGVNRARGIRDTTTFLFHR